MRNGGEWTESRYQSFIKSALRAASRRWPPRFQCLNEAFLGKRINKKSGRLANHYRCNECKGAFPAADVQVDHIIPIIDPTKGFTNWTDVIEAMYCEKDKLQILCKPCHQIKTNKEKEDATTRKKASKVSL